MWSASILAQQQRSRWEPLAWVLIVAQAAYVFLQGRREMFFFAVLCGLVFLYTRHQLTWRHVSFALIGAASLAMVAFPLYQAARVTIGERLGWEQERVTVRTYAQSVASGLTRPDIGEIYTENLKGRLAAYYRWQVRLAELRSANGGLNGELALAGMYYAIPRVLVRDKWERAWGERLIEEAYGWSARDKPNSVVAAGYMDFGIIGASMYGILLLVFLALMGQVAFVAARYSPLLGNGVIGVVILLALRTEITMVGVFASLRNILLLASGAIVLGMVSRGFRRTLRGRPLRDPGKRSVSGRWSHEFE